MERACMKSPLIRVNSPSRKPKSLAPPRPSPVLPNLPYAAFHQTVQVLPHRSNFLYRHNEQQPSRSYVMKKRPPAQIYHCAQCNKHIKYPSKITEHIRKHTGEKPHVCLICNMSFSQAHTLKNHMQQHAHERPFKCSFCTAEFLNLCDKDDHEEQHMHDHPETMEDNSGSGFIPVQAPSIEDEEEVEAGEICRIYECSDLCGFQSFDEAVVIEHMAIGHHQTAYDTVCWEDDTGDGAQNTEEPTVQEGNNRKMPINVIPVQEEIIVRDFNSEPEQIYEYFEEQFVPQVASEAIIDPSTSEEPCTQDSIEFREDPHFEENPGPSEPIVAAEVIYEGEEIVSAKKPERVISQSPAYHNILIPELVRDDEELGIEDEEEKVRVVVNPNPPKRGTKSLRDYHEASAAMTEMIVDASTLEMAAPIRHMKQGFPATRRKTRKKKAENLDWIIDAVAKGVDVNEASPHHRKKPTLHKCEYCGKVDKYPSKIRAHMRTHTGEKPFKCDICGMAFTQKTPMRLHLRRHLDQKPYECDVDGCKERFVSGAILKMHVEKKHLNKKKYVCMRGCGRVFSSAFNQRHHEKKCEVNTYLPWVETENNIESAEEESEYPEDEDVYMDALMVPSTSGPSRVAQYHMEEPVFLHQ